MLCVVMPLIYTWGITIPSPIISFAFHAHAQHWGEGREGGRGLKAA